MGLAVRIIPTLLKRGSNLVKGQRFSGDRVVGHVQQAARIHQARGVDELIILDLDATPTGRGPDLKAIRELTEHCFMPLTVGGGVKTIDDAKRLLDAGADKIAICSHPLSIEPIASRIGCQAIVAALDAKNGGTYLFGGTREMQPRPGYDCAPPAAIAQCYEEDGAGEILLTAIGREGTMLGYDLDLIRAVSQAVSIPVIANGGCSGPEDMLLAIEAGASAVAAGALFQFTDWTPLGCAHWLAEHAVEVRV